MSIASWVPAAVLMAGCIGGRDARVTAEDCVKLRDHRAALVVEQAAPHLDEAARAGHRDSISESAGEEFVKRCVDEMSVKVLECALEAGSIEAFDRCKDSGG